MLSSHAGERDHQGPGVLLSHGWTSASGFAFVGVEIVDGFSPHLYSFGQEDPLFSNIPQLSLCWNPTFGSGGPSLPSCSFTFQEKGPQHFSSCPFQSRKFYMASCTRTQLTNSSTTSPDILLFFSRSCIAQGCWAEMEQCPCSQSPGSSLATSSLFSNTQVPAEIRTAWGLPWTGPASNSSHGAGQSKVHHALLLSHAPTAGVAGAKKKTGNVVLILPWGFPSLPHPFYSILNVDSESPNPCSAEGAQIWVYVQ